MQQEPVREQYGPFTFHGPIPDRPELDGWTFSYQQEWLPGSYADKEALFLVAGLFLGNLHANVGLVDEFMSMLQERYNRARPSQNITVQMILRHWIPNFSR